MHDAIYYSFVLLLIAFLYWLSNRQIEYALARARLSEKTLERERDQLEVVVEERTREIKRLQMERVTELHHKAEFGNISSGAFHDLMNPLSSIHLITSEISNEAHEKIPEYKEYISHALNASRKMQSFLDVLRKQMRSDKDKRLFIPKQEIEEVLLLLSYKIKKAGCMVILKETEPCVLFGNSITFYQIVANLISNSIDAYEHTRHDKHINITFGKKGSYFVLEASDYGCGIAEENLTQVFESFFTTKERSKGSGLGLATTKHIIEKEFKGTITVQSIQDTITTFTITLPLHENKNSTNSERMPADNQKIPIT
jgi:signal transduction histidine kinase